MERDKKFIIRKFFNEYLDLNRSKEDEQVTWVECEFYGGNYRCNVDISADGTDYGSRTCCRVE